MKNTLPYLLLLTLGLNSCAQAPLAQTTNTTYEERTLHDPDGIGKFYMGREIANVMGFDGAAWLERPSREVTEQPDRVVQSLGLKPDAVVADIGAGTGYFSFRLSPLVPQGRVLAVDVQPEMVRVLTGLAQDRKITNVQAVLGTITDPKLPEPVDLVLMVDTYHEFSYPKEMMSAIVKSLKPGGRVVLIEYRAEDANVPIKPVHKMTQQQVRLELTAAGLVWQETKDFLPYQHLMIFIKAS
ncbi:class I SAM-dependent methyltransferase [Candidatus Cyanaurora vandensis]|uniref:class I SAM-dependent methyltransferase n=1 Tax=Candidatus Cyanaurora vandensis TaxID=2714958 RepID=UPI00257FA6C8|nr:class I SAM-dependent methyltransferase [Candidatus Cyanaurora vandensis]